jgi:hypothetical protein
MRKGEDTLASKFSNSQFENVSLFSGGLDSLIGIVDYFKANPSKKLLLVSHYDSNSGILIQTK